MEQFAIQNKLLEEAKLQDYQKENTVYLDEEVDRNSQVWFCRQLRRLGEKELNKDKTDRKPIKIRISSFGGWVVSYKAMVSEMLYWKDKGLIIETYCDGFAMSAGAYLLMCGTKGHRYTTRYSTILIHQTQLSGGQSTLQESRNSLKDNEKDWYELKEIMLEHTSMNEEEVEALTKYNLDVSLSSKEALEKGIIDIIL